ncbi:MAG: DJ-1/PfpI family protein [Armatimonadetes bacterium]|nr:DJ-1/PfpI family protein [Armatimonadota bacterium]
MKAQVILFPGFDELDALAPLEVLQNAAARGADLQVSLVTRDGAEEITAAHGTRLRPAGRLRGEDPPDLLLVPGGGWNARAPQEAQAEAERGDLPAVLADLHERGAVLAAVCTGAVLLAVGLIKGRDSAGFFL